MITHLRKGGLLESGTKQSFDTFTNKAIAIYRPRVLNSVTCKWVEYPFNELSFKIWLISYFRNLRGTCEDDEGSGRQTATLSVSVLSTDQMVSTAALGLLLQKAAL